MRSRRTNALHDHVHRNCEIYEFYAFVEISRDDRDCGKICVPGERTVGKFIKHLSAKWDTYTCNIPTRLKVAAQDANPTMSHFSRWVKTLLGFSVRTFRLLSLSGISGIGGGVGDSNWSTPGGPDCLPPPLALNLEAMVTKDVMRTPLVGGSVGLRAEAS